MWFASIRLLGIEMRLLHRKTYVTISIRRHFTLPRVASPTTQGTILCAHHVPGLLASSFVSMSIAVAPAVILGFTSGVSGSLAIIDFMAARRSCL